MSRLWNSSCDLQEERCQAVAVVAGDAVSSLETKEFLRRADQGCKEPGAKFRGGSWREFCPGF